MLPPSIPGRRPSSTKAHIAKRTDRTIKQIVEDAKIGAWTDGSRSHGKAKDAFGKRHTRAPECSDEPLASERNAVEDRRVADKAGATLLRS
jgi:hypothetical protein